VASIGVSKHEGAGNDFLLMVDLDDRVQLTDDEVRWMADRHRGIGADGVITITAGTHGGDITMRLANADGSPAEISGNGLRCVVHEAVRSGLVAPGWFNVMTGAGLRRVHCEELEGRTASTTASMGTVDVLELDAMSRRGTVDVGNPHLVIVVDDLGALDPDAEGRRLQGERPGGINVEWIEVTGPDSIELVVFERGVGLTLACGSGSCAAAAVARSLDLVGDQVEVANPGGVLGVRFDGAEAFLSGDVSHVADLLIPLERAL
jgi:diaminopimelate epimerase